MAKRKLNWLSDFNHRYKPSPSFLSCMDNELRQEYTRLTNNEFDVEFLFIEFQDDLNYARDTNEALLKASPRYKGNYAGECYIYWKHKFQKKLVMPNDEIQEGEVSFQWLKLVYPDLSLFPAKPNKILTQRLDLILNYELVSEHEAATQDLDFYLQLTDPTVVEAMTKRLALLQETWNEQADQDPTRQKGYIHWLSFEHEEEGEFVFRMDVGSSGNEGLKAVLNEFNDPEWGIKRVEIFDI